MLTTITFQQQLYLIDQTFRTHEIRLRFYRPACQCVALDPAAHSDIRTWCSFGNIPQELNSRNELSTAVFQLFQLHCILLIGSSSTHTNIIAILNTDIFPSSLLITQATLNGNPAPRTSTATDSFTADIVLSGSTAARSALRANGKDQQEEEQKGYLSTLMSSFGIPRLHDGRNEGGILPSDEVLSVADEKDGHAVRLFISIKKYLFLFRSSNIFSFSFQHDNCMYFHWHFFFFQSTFNINTIS